MSLTLTGSGNAITDITKNGTTLTATKGATFLTAITKAMVENVLTGDISSHSHPKYLNKYGADGVLEIARYIDFHTIASGILGTEDYTVRLDAGATATARTFTFPSSGGVLATEAWVTGKNYVALDGVETISGLKTFSSGIAFSPVAPTDTAPTIFSEVVGENTKLVFRVSDDDYDGFIFRSLRYGQPEGTNYDILTINWAGITASKNITAPSFIKSGGTSTQALMANGDTRAVNLLSTVTNLGWSSTSGHLATINTLAYWNGQHSAGASNLQYCDRGRFGTMATATATDYLARSGGSMTNTNLVTSLNADLWDGTHLSDFKMRRVYSLNLANLSSSNFYPVTFGAGKDELDCEIRSQSFLGSEPYNCNFIHFLMAANGWSDMPKTFVVISQGNYQNGEVTIGAVGLGNNQGERCVWIRGGLSYTFICNYTPTLRASNYTFEDETYTVGTGLSGGTNSKVSIMWANDDNRRNPVVATIGSNVASATKLADNTARTAWGQTFFENGQPKTISGTLSGVSGVNFSNGVGAFNLDAWGNFNASSASGNSWNVRKMDGSTTMMRFMCDGSSAFVDVTKFGVSNSNPAYKLDVNGEIRSSAANGLRITQGNYGFILRNDSANTFFLFTNSGDANGTWNNLRPISINNASGHVIMSHGLTVNSLTIGSCTLTWDSTNKGLHVTGGGLYADTYVSAVGADTSSAPSTALSGQYVTRATMYGKTSATTDEQRREVANRGWEVDSDVTLSLPNDSAMSFWLWNNSNDDIKLIVNGTQKSLPNEDMMHISVYNYSGNVTIKITQ